MMAKERSPLRRTQLARPRSLAQTGVLWTLVRSPMDCKTDGFEARRGHRLHIDERLPLRCALQAVSHSAVLSKTPRLLGAAGYAARHPPFAMVTARG